VESNDAELISVWSPMGSPGKSTIALSIAAELAESGKKVFLLDADTWSPSLDLQLGLTDHPAGLAAACRLVAQERFDLEQLNRLSTELRIGAGSLTVMTGLSSQSGWAEVSSEKLDDLLMVASKEFDFVVLDVASPIDGGLFWLTSPVERNAVSRWAVTYSDKVVAICGADPISVARFLSSAAELSELNPKGQVFNLVNRLRTSVLGASAKQQIIQTLSRMGQLEVSGFIPDDPAAADAALKDSVPIALGKRSSQARLAIALFTRTQLLAERNKLDGRLGNRAIAKLG
jgi:MinD-like ATPase involved in chromosome partitioning or flagellar assembly